MIVETASSITYYVAAILCLPTGIVFFFIVLRKSPKSIRIYRNNIVNLTIWYFADTFLIGLILQPVFTMHGDVPCAKIAGVAGSFGIELANVTVTICLIIAANGAVALWLCFLVRYVQVACSRLASYLGSVYGAAFSIMSHTLGIGYSLYISLSLIADQKSYVVRGSAVLCFEMSSDFSASMVVASLGVAMIGLCSMLLCFMILTIVELRRQRSIMSSKTYRLQLLLCLNLVMLTAIPIVFEVIPVAGACAALYFNSPLMETSVLIGTHTPFLDMILSCAVTLAFVTPYRRALIEMFVKNNSKTFVATTALNYRNSVTHR